MEEQKKPTKKETSEKQTYKFMDCPTCKAETRFVSTLSPTGDWICCRCRRKISGKPFKLETDPQGFKICKDVIK